LHVFLDCNRRLHHRDLQLTEFSDNRIELFAPIVGHLDLVDEVAELAVFRDVAVAYIEALLVLRDLKYKVTRHAWKVFLKLLDR